MNQITEDGSEQEQMVTNQDQYEEMGSTNRPQAVECLNDESEYELN